ncbi:hypothetical protein BpHYR1_054550, partial [Brachionus plicatilis]
KKKLTRISACASLSFLLSSPLPFLPEAASASQIAGPRALGIIVKAGASSTGIPTRTGMGRVSATTARTSLAVQILKRIVVSGPVVVASGRGRVGAGRKAARRVRRVRRTIIEAGQKRVVLVQLNLLFQMLEHFAGKFFLAGIFVRRPERAQFAVDLVFGLFEFERSRYVLGAAVIIGRSLGLDVRGVRPVAGVVAVGLVRVGRRLLVAAGLGLGVAKVLRVLEGLALVGRLRLHRVINALPILQHIQVLFVNAGRLRWLVGHLHLHMIVLVRHVHYLAVQVGALFVQKDAQVAHEHRVQLGVVWSEQLDVVAVQLAAGGHVLQFDHGQNVLFGGHVDQLEQAAHQTYAGGH